MIIYVGAALFLLTPIALIVIIFIERRTQNSRIVTIISCIIAAASFSQIAVALTER